ncbi:DMT family transporter [Ammoniphilus sp. CFH 90114]|uniref:EamA family transporter n=1 Tax=Ammoniphilus sp. CFH 90114 TaxID=2493665 RepID=UPI00100F568E|nr:DMT family transporter [Ammoniphilus sp. CFH 90114]RXT15356.1 EamA family transporter [Ammoniphilus sp. CFH 90114]
MAFGGAALWGISGTVAEVLFIHIGIPMAWLVTIRLLLAGLLLVLYTIVNTTWQQTSAVWKSRADRIQLIWFGILGMLGVQYTYFAAIEVGNAATATLLQFLGPVFITLYLALRYLRLPTIMEYLALGLALLGTYLLVTNGSTEGLSITPSAVGWGLGAAITAAFYTLYPAQLLKRWGSMSVVGWGMLIGGIGMSFINPPWLIDITGISLMAWLGIAFVILFGTLIPFYLVLESLRYLAPSEVGMLNSAEPLSAVIFSVLWLQLSFGLYEMLGALCIIATVIVLSLNQRKVKPKQVESAAAN